MRTTLLIPTLNEIDGLRSVMGRIRKEWVDQILLVDGDSDDGTRSWLEESGYDFFIQERKGLRHAFIEAYDRIEGDIVITFSPDGNSIPELIPALLEEMKKGHDMVIVSRYKDDARSYDDDPVTAFGNRLFTSAINILHGASYTDAMVMFRAYRKSIIKQLDLHKDITYSVPERIFFTRLGWEPILSVRAAKAGLDIAEIPGDEPERLGGKRKLQVVRWGLAYMTQVIAEKFFWKAPRDA